MSVFEILELLQEKQINVFVEGKALKIDAPKGAMTAEFLELLKENKSKIIEYLSKAGSEAQSIPVADRTQPLLLSFAQQRLWFIDQMDIGNSNYNIPGAFQVVGKLDIHAAEAAFLRIIQRHEPLRTTFADGGQAPTQVVQDISEFSIPVVDLSEFDKSQQEQRVNRAIKANTKQTFNLSRDVLLKVSFYRLAQSHGILLFNIHHIAADGWSIAILVDEFEQHYCATLEGKEAMLEPLKIHYADYAQWQRDWLTGSQLETQLAYWREQLAEIPQVHQYPLDKQRPEVQSYHGAKHEFKFSASELSALKSLAIDNQATLFMVLHAAFSWILCRYSNQQDIVIGTPVANRLHKQQEALIGFFVNTLVLRTQCKSDMTFREFLDYVKEINLTAQAHQEIPFEYLVDDLNPARSTQYNALFQILFSMNNNENRSLDLPEVSLTPLPSVQINAKFDLSLNISEQENQLEASFIYNTDLFLKETIAGLAESFQQLVKEILLNPNALMGNLNLLTKSEYNYQINSLNNTSVQFQHLKCVHHLFEEQVLKEPNATAVVFDNHQLTYAELNQRANQLARELVAQGVSHENLIGLCVDRSLEMLVSILAILKAGGAYLPLDPSYPVERIEYMMHDSQLKYLVSQSEIVEGLQLSNDIHLTLLDDAFVQSRLLNYSPDNLLLAHQSSQDLAYVIYTSGSTGNPKGVMIEHRGLCNLQQAQRTKFEITENSRVLQFASMSFDAAVSEWVMALTCGASLYLVNRDVQQSLSRLTDAISQYHISHVTLPPALLAVFDTSALSSVSHLIVAGEKCPLELALRWSQGRKFYNAYGPSEVTVCASIRQFFSNDEQIDIGRAIDNTKLFVMSPEGELLPRGAVGELFIGGVGLARGYLNRSALSAERFVENPFTSDPKDRLYRTGDFVRYLADDNLSFIGRVDDQVKLRGYRIELGEIEAHIMKSELVSACLVLMREDESDNKILAYLVANQNCLKDSAITNLSIANELRNTLRAKLPDYMIPSNFVVLDQLPLTANGKVDKKRLAELELNIEIANYQSPEGDTERRVCNIWSELLKIEAEKISRTASFFELGGHSLLSIRLIASVRAEFNVELSIRDIFGRPQLTFLAQLIDSSNSLKRPPVIPLTRRNIPLTTSYAQQRLWFINKAEGGSTHYNIPGAFTISGHFDVKAAEKAFAKIIQRHEPLRTVFVDNGQGVDQLIQSGKHFSIDVFDLKNLDEFEQSRKIKLAMGDDASQTFDLSSDLMLRVSYYELTQTKGVLLFNIHHIAADGWSIGILAEEFEAFYRSAIVGNDISLPPIAIQYADYAQWQRDWLSGSQLEKQLAYWQKQLCAMPNVHKLPLDKSRPQKQTYDGAIHQFSLSEQELSQFKAIAINRHASLFMALHSVFVILLSRYSNQRDIVIGTPVANRLNKEVEPLIGFFVNTLVLRTIYDGDASFNEFLDYIKQVNLDAQEHQDLPFEYLVDHVNPERSTSHSALFQIMFSMNNNEIRTLELPDAVLNPIAGDKVVAKYDLVLNMNEQGEQLNANFVYNRQLFSPETIVRLARCFKTLVASILNDLDLPIKNLEIIDREDKERLIQNSIPRNLNFSPNPKSSSDSNLKAQTLLSLFEEQAFLTPQSSAVIKGNIELSYLMLEEKSNQLAHYLISEGVKSETLVAIALEPTFETIISILGVFKAGGAYLPIDVGLPASRQQALLQDSNAQYLLTFNDSLLSINNNALHVVDFGCERMQNILARQDKFKPSTSGKTAPENLAYMIYTSGTTGLPKGVLVEQRNLTSFISAFQQQLGEFKMSSSSPWLWNVSYAFDASLKGLASLVLGRSLILVENDIQKDPFKLIELVKEHGIEVLNATPKMLESILQVITQNNGPNINLISSGELLPENLLNKLLDYCNKTEAQVINAYGPTETTVNASYALITRDTGIGKACINSQVYILDKTLNFVPQGGIGELFVGGDGVARGYHQRSSIEGESFVSQSLVRDQHATSSKRLYKTGDLARFDEAGNLIYLGRTDRQIKLRGYRIELDEIEQQLALLSEVESCAVMEFITSCGDNQITAYFTTHAVLDASIIIENIRRGLSELLPSYMIPAIFLQIDSLPLTSSGKTDYHSLPKPEVKHYAKFIKPIGWQETELAKIWKELLNVEDEISANANFFHVGGHSLLTIRMISDIRERLQVEISINDIFNSPVLSELAKVIETSTKLIRPPIAHNVNYHEEVPVSFAQQRLWFINQLDHISFQYNIPASFTIEGKFDIAIAERAFETIVERHAPLRTTFRASKKYPVQVINQLEVFKIRVLDISELATELQNEKILQEVEKNAHNVFDLSHDLLLSVSYLRLNKNKGILLFNVHHIAADGWSMGILTKEFIHLYEAYSSNLSQTLPPLSIEYADYALWQRNWLQDDELDSQLDYWKQQLSNLPAVHQMPLDLERPAYQAFNGAHFKFTVEHSTMTALKLLAEEKGCTLFMVLYAAFCVLISRYSNNTDIVIGTPSANRLQKELESLIGFFVNTLVLRLDCAGDQSFLQLLTEARKVNLESQSNQDIPFEVLVEHLNPERSTAHNPLFQLMFSMNNNEATSLNLAGIKMSPMQAEQVTSKFDLSLLAGDENSNTFVFEYNTDLFFERKIIDLANSYTTLLNAIASNPSQQVKDFVILSDPQQEFLTNQLNQTFVEHPVNQCIHQLFEEQVLRTPDNIAVVSQLDSITYSELNQKANRLARYLIERGVKPDSFVGLCVERSIDMMVGLLAILKAGAAYLPLDPSYPQQRLSYMLSHSQVALVISQSSLLKELQFKECDVVDIEDCEHLNRYSIDNISPQSINLSANNLAYIIYTSGSTGNPKGVTVEHRNETNLLYWYIKEYSLCADDRVLILSAIGFDLTQKNLFAPLLCGASVEFATSRYYDIAQITDFIFKRKITFTNCAPSVFYPLVETQESVVKLNSLRCVLFGGEAIAFDRLKLWLDVVGDEVTLINMYGPTECTDIACAYHVPLSDINQAPIIGKPNDNVSLFVLDENLQLAPYGVAGELYIGGKGVSRGYLNQPQMNREKFIFHSLLCEKGETIYKTGDMVRWSHDGDLEFIGRIDNQVKIRGFRVELGEIESLLVKHPLVQQSVVIYEQAKDELIAHLVVHDEKSFQVKSVVDLVKSSLPSYMVPKLYTCLPSLPLSEHGKIDRKALPTSGFLHIENDYTAPSNKTEDDLCKIWQELLKIHKPVSVTANFFELGGHSLLLTQMLHIIAERMDYQLNVKDIFESPTIVELAVHILNQEQSASYRIEKSTQSLEQYPLSYSQYRVWFIEQLKDETNEHNMLSATEISGELDPDSLQLAVEYMLEKHEILRTRFSSSKEAPVQIIEQNLEFELKYIDACNFDESDKQHRIDTLTKAHDKQSFDLSQLPLFSILVIRKAQRQYLIHFNIHHIISDGWSRDLFYKELLTIYQLVLTGKTLPVIEEEYQYKDYALWQERWLGSEHAEKQRTFWKDYLRDCQEQLILPIQKSGNQMLGEQQHCEIAIDLETINKLKRISQTYKGSLFNILHCCFAILLSRLSGKSDFNIGIPVSGRHIFGTQKILGMFLNNLPVRHNIDLSKALSDTLLEQIENIESVLSNQDLPFEKIVELCSAERNSATTPLFQVFFNMLSLPKSEFDTSNLGLEHSQGKTEELENKFNLSLYLNDTGEGLDIYCHFNNTIFTQPDIQLILSQYRSLLTEAADNLDKPCGSYTLNVEPKKIDYDKPLKQFGNLSVFELFSKRVAEMPQSLALKDEISEWTYSELNFAVTSLAKELFDEGVAKGDVICILAARNSATVISILASLQVGAVYTLCSPQMPVARVKQQQVIAEPKLLLLSEPRASYTEELKQTVLDLTSSIEVNNRYEDYYGRETTNEFISSLMDDPACITFTSGTSGIPKGVVGSHIGLTGYLKWLPSDLDITHTDRFSLLSGLLHDPLQREIFGALCLGATLVIPDNKTMQSYQLSEWLKQNQISILHLTPALGDLVCHQNLSAITSLRRIFLTGETLKNTTAQSLLLLNDQVRVFNCYGTTETQRAATYMEIEKGVALESLVHTGAATKDTRLRLINAQGIDCGIGEVGQIYTESYHIALGYLNDEALTKQKFTPLKNGGKRYSTGDSGVYINETSVKYLGRADNQINIRGYRIELGEIENTLSHLEEVKSAVAAVKDNQHIIVFIVKERSFAASKDCETSIRQQLGNILPEYMQPSAYAFIDAIPLTNNGKVDRTALPMPQSIMQSISSVQPETEIEKKLRDVWSDLLGMESEQICTTVNFFEIGGHSLLLLKLIGEIKACFGVDAGIKVLFESKSLKGMALTIDSLQKQLGVAHQIASAAEDEIEEVEF